jgi:hypothetical protein
MTVRPVELEIKYSELLHGSIWGKNHYLTARSTWEAALTARLKTAPRLSLGCLRPVSALDPSNNDNHPPTTTRSQEQPRGSKNHHNRRFSRRYLPIFLHRVNGSSFVLLTPTPPAEPSAALHSCQTCKQRANDVQASYTDQPTIRRIDRPPLDLTPFHGRSFPPQK